MALRAVSVLNAWRRSPVNHYSASSSQPAPRKRGEESEVIESESYLLARTRRLTPSHSAKDIGGPPFATDSRKDEKITVAAATATSNLFRSTR